MGADPDRPAPTAQPNPTRPDLTQVPPLADEEKREAGNMAGIATYYRGVEYRSRLEARWAAFMHDIGWDITYEPFDGNGYIPDFLVAGPSPMLVEVKPAVTLADYEAPIKKAEAGLRGHWEHDILIVGASPLPSSRPQAFGNAGDLPAGWLGEFGDWGLYDNDYTEFTRTHDWAWDAAEWFKCANCGSICVYHTEMCFNGRPCGCYEGDHYLGYISRNLIEQHWANACNDVKWRGRVA